MERWSGGVVEWRKRQRPERWRWNGPYQQYEERQGVLSSTRPASSPIPARNGARSESRASPNFGLDSGNVGLINLKLNDDLFQSPVHRQDFAEFRIEVVLKHRRPRML